MLQVQVGVSQYQKSAHLALKSNLAKSVTRASIYLPYNILHRVTCYVTSFVERGENILQNVELVLQFFEADLFVVVGTFRSEIHGRRSERLF